MRRILFVDDEPHVLDGLKRTLRSQRHVWHMAFAADGATALACLAAEPYDAVVTDMRMPGMDGAMLLAAVCERHPAVVRIVLTGFSELEGTLRAATVAHQFLRKPCDVSVLKAVIDRQTSGLGGLISRPTAELVGALTVLPSEPATYRAMRAAVTRSPVPIEEIAAAVEQDVALAARIQHLASSGVFGTLCDTGDLEGAVSSLGATIIAQLMLEVELFRAFEPQRPVVGFEIDRFQRHARLTAEIAARLAPRDSALPMARLSAFLHDVGTLVLAERAPDQLGEAIRRARDERRPVFAIEEEIFGASHAEVGAYLLNLWGLPRELVQAVAHHHHPDRAEVDRVGVIVALADRLAHAYGATRDQPADGLVHQAIDASLLAAMGETTIPDAWPTLVTEAARTISERPPRP